MKELEDILKRLEALESRGKYVSNLEDEILLIARRLSLMVQGGYVLEPNGTLMRHGFHEEKIHTEILKDQLLGAIKNLGSAALADIYQGKV